MLTFLTIFLSNIPIWVPFVFVLLIIVGLRSAQSRQVPIAVIACLPLLGILTLRNVTALDPSLWLWGFAICAYLIGAVIGARLQARWIISKTGRFVELKGEWLTMAAVMALFAAGFVNGAMTSIAPDITSTVLFLVLYSAVICLAAGQFLGRAITTLRAT